MNGSLLVRRGLLFSILLSFMPSPALAVMPTNPVTDSEFLRLPDGKMLSSISVSGSSLRLTKGTGQTFGATARAAYEALKAETLADPHHKVQWTLMDLDSHQVIA